MLDTTNMYWEDYDDQSEDDFTHVGYTNLKGEPVVEKITGCLIDMVNEIRRCNGSDTAIKVYR